MNLLRGECLLLLKFNFRLHRYCNQYVDKDALIYLILANEMLHELHPDIVTIAEDVSCSLSLSKLFCLYFDVDFVILKLFSYYCIGHILSRIMRVNN